MFIRPCSGNRGFTVAEMIIVVAVMAILISISTPAFFTFYNLRDRNSEEAAQTEIRKAMQAYLADKGALPTDNQTNTTLLGQCPTACTASTWWASELAGYTNLSQQEILNDVWNRERRYIVYLDQTRQIQGSAVPVYYATLFSRGADGKASNKDASGNIIPGISLSGSNFATPAQDTGKKWWRRLADTTQIIPTFSSLRAGGDDIMIRFTDYPEKLDAYNTTMQRLERLGQAVETYARNGYGSLTANCASRADPSTGIVPASKAPYDSYCNNGQPEKYIYYPKAKYGSTDDAAVYFTNAPVSSGTGYVVDNTADVTTRRNGMLSLVRLLGLPDEMCCSAITNGTDGKPLPFYYFPNPRARLTTTSCGARPNASAVNRLPARITTTNTSNPATCG